MIKQFTRTFHPVGQGAFYAEKIVAEGGQQYNIVYDCGSETLMPFNDRKGDRLKKYINSTFSQGEVIDLLFLSHFHADHINGLNFLKDRCRIKRVILPLLDDEVKIIAKISAFVQGNISAISLIENPSLYFGDNTTIIQVRSVNRDENINNQEEILYLDENDKQQRSYKINSGVRIQLMSTDYGHKNLDWIFIPFNYELKERNQVFIEKLKEFKLELSEIETIDQIVANESKIKAAYKAVDKGLNSHSLILYSGNEDTQMGFYNGESFCLFRYLGDVSSGCLYLGDIDLNQMKIVNEIEDRLASCWNKIGIVQIPHHGSRENYNPSIIPPQAKYAIISYGTSNTHGHPSSKVQESLIIHKVHPFHVTEIQSSILIQFRR